jgi:trk system potassium uptake protein TrkH
VFGFAILFVEKGDMFDILFELFSAFGNVGLSLGVTPNLTTLGKIIIMMTMLAGKVGTLTLVLAISQIRQLNKNIAYEYTEEDVTIG